jgi:hypothetical protein
VIGPGIATARRGASEGLSTKWSIRSAASRAPAFQNSQTSILKSSVVTSGSLIRPFGQRLVYVEAPV